MVDIVDRNTVQQEQILIRVTSANIQSGGSLGSGLDAGPQLLGLEHIGLTEHGGNRLDLFYGYIHGAHL